MIVLPCPLNQRKTQTFGTDCELLDARGRSPHVRSSSPPIVRRRSRGSLPRLHLCGCETVEQWRVEGYFGKRAQRCFVQDLRLTHSAPRPAAQAV